MRAILDEEVRPELAMIIEKGRDQVDEFNILFRARELREPAVHREDRGTNFRCDFGASHER
jgi:hypothetical protein